MAELRRHPLSITAQINLAHIRKMRRKFEPANDDERHATEKQRRGAAAALAIRGPIARPLRANWNLLLFRDVSDNELG
jgi:hypothetical protein